MLPTVKTEPKALADYQGVVDDSVLTEIKQVAQQLAGARVLHLNATKFGGGVSEILRAEVPLMQDLGLKAEWQVLTPAPGFFEVTKLIHNALQGDPDAITPDQWQLYERYNQTIAAKINPNAWDYIFVHDPQPAAVRQYLSEQTTSRWIWRCHLDSSHPNQTVAARFAGYLEPYDGSIFTMQQYVLPGLSDKMVAITPVTIDPLSEKNKPMETAEAKKIVAKCGIDPDKPLVTQVSRFDPWKDPVGVIEAWRQARQAIPDLQLALVGNSAVDDPQGPIILGEVMQAANEEGLFIIANTADDRTVKAFQTASVAVIQKSLREGFGLTVTEALWAGTPVVGTKIGGIVLQIENGQNGFLVESIAEAAEAIVTLVSDPKAAEAMGKHGHDKVGERFLLPHLVRDDLNFLNYIGNLKR